MFNRSWIFRRAHEMRRWNPTKDFAWALSYAWVEAKNGTLPDFSPLGLVDREIDSIRRNIGTVENSPSYDFEMVNELHAKLQDAISRRASLTPSIQQAA